VIETRLAAALKADFVVALYNPISKARPWQLGRALDIARTIHAAQTPVVFARAVGRPDERIAVADLADADAGQADMATLVMIGASTTRRVGPYLYTPRSYGIAP